MVSFDAGLELVGSNAETVLGGEINPDGVEAVEGDEEIFVGRVIGREVAEPDSVERGAATGEGKSAA